MAFSICVHFTVHFGQGFKGLPQLAGSAIVMVKQARGKCDGMFKWV